MANTSNESANVMACFNSFDTIEQCDWLKRCKKISASLSIIGCLSTIFIIWLYKKYTEFSQRMIIHLSIATLLQAIFYLLVDIEDKELRPTAICKAQGALLQFTSWVILLWITWVIFNLLWNVMWLKHLEKYEAQITLLCWGLPMVIAAIPFAYDAYAPAGAWCWYRNSFGWMFGTWYVWSMLSFVFIFISIVVITYKLRLSSKDVIGTFDAENVSRRKSIREAVRTLRIYPIAYFMVILFPTIHRIQNIIEGTPDDHNSRYALVLLHSLADPLDGAVITLVFVLDRRTRHVLKPKCIWEALKKKFQSSVEIHELTLKSRLSRSDFIIAARLSISSIEVSADGDSRYERETLRRTNIDGTLEPIQEVEANCNIKIISRAKTEELIVE